MFFWRRGRREEPEENAESPQEEVEPPESTGFTLQEINIPRDAQRPAAILRVAGELERRGAKIVELFKEISSPRGRTVFPLYVTQGGEDYLIDVRTEAWDPTAVREALEMAAIVRDSEQAEATLELLSVHPIPEELTFLFSRSPGALLQLDLLGEDSNDPTATAESFRKVAGRHWDVELDYALESLPLVEELLLAALGRAPGDQPPEEGPPILDGLVRGLGCYLGEVIRRNATAQSSWRTADDWGERDVLEFQGLSADPIGKARAFLSEGSKDSVSFYAEYALSELKEIPEDGDTASNR